jgi:hypothetical protein
LTSSSVYIAAARVLAATALRHENISAVVVRRSAAAGEAVFPWSDLDLEINVRRACGADLSALLKRYRLGRALFPRLGECHVVDAAEIAAHAALDPYRASINRRAALTVRGAPPEIPRVPIPQREVLRRLVFWMESYVPLAMRGGNSRNLEKFRLEMENALGVLEGRWPEPLVSRRETALVCGPCERPFERCCEIVRRAHERLGWQAPQVAAPVAIGDILLIPSDGPRWPAGAPPGMVATPEALHLVLRTQNPFLWLRHGQILGSLGFHPPESHEWLAACLRYTDASRLRAPGFADTRVAAFDSRLELAEHILTALERDRVPAPLEPAPSQLAPVSVCEYYALHYDRLAGRAGELARRPILVAAASRATCITVSE